MTSVRADGRGLVGGKPLPPGAMARHPVKRYPEGATMMGQERRIVVGVDGSDLSLAALRWAIRQAKRTGATVDAVTVWHSPAACGGAPAADGATDFEGAAKKTVLVALLGASGVEPRVPVRPLVVHGHAAKVLLDSAADADLLVVGGREHGEFALAESVSLYCVLHARCPVLVLRDER
jgi:nucleotide-binding universal stress UspA family protein